MSDIKEQYEKIAQAYQTCKKTALKDIYSENPTFRKLCEKVTNKEVIDLGCGDGYYARIAKESGAKKVISIDVAEQQIRLAEKIEQDYPLGIQYLVGDVLTFDFSTLGTFDVVIAGYFFDYADSIKSLQRMCTIMGQILRPGGQLLTITNNPKARLPNDTKYGVGLSSPSNSYPLRDGDKRIITFFNKNNEERLSFWNYYWSKHAYEQGLRDAGFVNIVWHQPIVSSAGLEAYGEEFWSGWLENPTFVGLTAEKR